jgi:hypothetical protein
MRRVVAERGMAAVEVEIGVEVVGHLQSGFFEAGKRAAMRQRFGFECAPPVLSLGVIVGVTWPVIAGQRLGFFDARPAIRPGVLTATVGVNNQAGSRLTQRQSLLQGREHQLGRHLLVEVPADYPPRAGIALGHQVTPAPAEQRQVADIPNPDLIWSRGRGLTKEQVFGYDCRGVGHGGARALRPSAECPQALATQPTAQGVMFDGGDFQRVIPPANVGCRSAGHGAKRQQ